MRALYSTEVDPTIEEIEYGLATALDTDTLSHRVNHKLENGWQLYGNLVISDKVFAQALIKITYKPTVMPGA